MKTKIFILVSLFLFHNANYAVIISTKKPIENLQIGKNFIGDLQPNQLKDIDLSYGFGSVKYEGYINNQKVVGLIKRDNFEHTILWQSIVYGLITMPIFATIGYLLANPHWFHDKKDNYKYKHLTMSSFTIPLTSLFAMIGSFPFIGLYFSEKPSQNIYYVD